MGDSHSLHHIDRKMASRPNPVSLQEQRNIAQEMEEWGPDQATAHHPGSGVLCSCLARNEKNMKTQDGRDPSSLCVAQNLSPVQRTENSLAGRPIVHQFLPQLCTREKPCACLTAELQ